MHFFNPSTDCSRGQVDCPDLPYRKYLAPSRPALNRPALNRLAPNPPAPLLKISASMMVEILTGSITQVRALNSRPPL